MKNTELLQLLNHIDTLRIDKKIFEIEDEIKETKEKINYKDSIL